MIKKYLQGNLYGRLFVMWDFEKPIGKTKKNMHYCHCICVYDGNVVDVCASHLTTGHTTSCGCYLKEQTKKSKNIKHNLSYDKFYKRYRHIVDRCHNPKDKAYKNYGARGIKILPYFPTAKDFVKFAREKEKEAFEIYGKDTKLSFDRIDNNKGYSPDNLRLVPYSIQNRNKRNNVIIEGLCLIDFCKKYNISYNSVHVWKIRHNCTVQEAVQHFLGRELH